MGINLDNQRAGTIPGGVRFECGCITASADGTVWVPTTLTKVLGGMCVADLTDSCGGYVQTSFCVGPTIQFSMTDSTGNTSVYYVAWGF